MREQLLIVVATVILVMASQSKAYADDVFVDAYKRANGILVPGHYRTNPDSTVNNNWVTKGNVNPYTSKPGYKPREYSRSIAFGLTSAEQAESNTNKEFINHVSFIDKHLRHRWFFNLINIDQEPTRSYGIRRYPFLGYSDEFFSAVTITKSRSYYLSATKNYFGSDRIFFSYEDGCEVSDADTKVTIYGEQFFLGHSYFKKLDTTMRCVEVRGESHLAFIFNDGDDIFIKPIREADSHQTLRLVSKEAMFDIKFDISNYDKMMLKMKSIRPGGVGNGHKGY